MKRFVFFVIFVVLGLLTLSVTAQNFATPVATTTTTPDLPATTSANSTAVPEPPWPGPVYQLIDGKLVPLTKETLSGSTKPKTKFLGVGGSTASIGYEITGLSCPTTVPENVVLVVKTMGMGQTQAIVPELELRVDRLTVDTSSGSRKLPMSKSKYSAFSGASTAESADTTVGLNPASYGAHSLSFTAKFLPGEYLARTGTGAFCFQVK